MRTTAKEFLSWAIQNPREIRLTYAVDIYLFTFD